MIPVDEALARILATVTRTPAEVVPLHEAGERVLAADVVATIDVPPFRASAMDGWAVRAADTDARDDSGDTDDGAVLRVVGAVTAGVMPSRSVGPGEAIGVTTGAPLPEGADAVALVEDATRHGSEVRIRGAVAPGRWVRPRGADVRTGDVVAAAGTRLTPARLGLLASIGRVDVEVAQRPRVVVVTTGDEVVRPGAPLRPGQIHGSNHLVLLGLTREAGAIGIDGGHAPDDPDAIREALERALAGDVVVTTGGVSVGDKDHVRDVLADLGVPLAFWKVRMKPGKPVAFGVASRDGRAVPVFGLPGNPVSCAVGFLELVRPWLRASLGDPRPFLPVVDAVAAEDLRSRPGRARFERVLLEVGPDGLRARGAGDPSSGVLSTLGRASGLLPIGPDDPGPSAGDPIRVHLLDDDALRPSERRFGW